MAEHDRLDAPPSEAVRHAIEVANGAAVAPNGVARRLRLRSLPARLRGRVRRVLGLVPPGAPPAVIMFKPGGNGAAGRDTLVAPSYSDLAVPCEKRGGRPDETGDDV